LAAPGVDDGSLQDLLTLPRSAQERPPPWLSGKSAFFLVMVCGGLDLPDRRGSACSHGWKSLETMAADFPGAC
jgi:hypothetical protein